MITKIEYIRSKENQQNHDLVPILLASLTSLTSLLAAIERHDSNKITIDGKLLQAIDSAQSLIDSLDLRG